MIGQQRYLRIDGDELVPIVQEDSAQLDADVDARVDPTPGLKVERPIPILPMEVVIRVLERRLEAAHAWRQLEDIRRHEPRGLVARKRVAPGEKYRGGGEYRSESARPLHRCPPDSDPKPYQNVPAYCVRERASSLTDGRLAASSRN